MPFSLGAVLLFLAPTTAPMVTDSSRRECSLNTTFGPVCVDSANMPAAIEEGAAAQMAASVVLGLRDVRFSIEEENYTSRKWGDRSSSGAPIYVWQFKKGAGTPAQPPPAYLLRHEIGHDLFIRYLVPSTKSDQYGGDAPDWLDEMAAVAFEGEALRSTRRLAAVRYAREAKLMPLRKFLTMVHPEMEAKSIPVSPDGLTNAFEAVSGDTSLFYVMASAFYDFLVARTKNRAVVAELAAAFRNGEDLERWILVHTDHKGGIQSLNADFLAWIASDARYGGRVSH